MSPVHKKQAKIELGLGLVFILTAVTIGVTASQSPDGFTQLTGTLWLASWIFGAVLFIWGCFVYAKGKGYSAALGLLGLLFVVGLIVLMALPDKMKEPQPGFPGTPPGV